MLKKISTMISIFSLLLIFSFSIQAIYRNRNVFHHSISVLVNRLL